MDFYRINEEYNQYLQKYEKENYNGSVVKTKI